MTKSKREYFTNPLGDINFCNECKEPIEKSKGRYHIDIKDDCYIKNRRFSYLYGYKTFCRDCFEKLFDKSWKDSESIYKESS